MAAPFQQHIGMSCFQGQEESLFAEGTQATLAQVRKGEVDGILVPGPVSLNIPGFVLEATSQQAIPTMCTVSFYVERGGFASYGPDLHETGRQAARLVDKILKGTKPAEIPVEVNTKIEFAINLKVAKTLGLTIAPEVLCGTPPPLFLTTATYL